MTRHSVYYSARLDLAATREFSRPGAGPARRERLASHAEGYLTNAWREATASVGLGCDPRGVALAVVGSQARRDAGPLSDLDLVLLHDGRGAASRRIDALAQALWYPMWDAGVRFDHAVRTPKECRSVAGGDLVAAVGLLDLTPVAGDGAFAVEVRHAVAADWRGAARTRLPELLDSLHARHARFGALGTSGEPDLKEAAGGLRDVGLVSALTTAWLADPGRSRLPDAHASLLDVRDALHVVTGRRRERLAAQEQDAVAALLGHAERDDLLTRIVDAGRTVSYVVDAALRSAQQSQRARALRVGPRKPTMTPLGHGLHLHDGEVVLAARADPATAGLTLLRAARAAAVLGTRVAPRTLTNLCDILEPVSTPWPQAERAALVDLLAAGPGLVEVWEALDHAGAIVRWLPEWARVRSRPQHNAVHRFTVDRHSIEAVVQAAAMRERVNRPDLLLVGALLHDIGKVAGSRDHSVEGAPVARQICARAGFDEADAALVELLVRHHLVLADLATKRDPQEPATTATLCTAVDERLAALDLLVALTEADARAAGPQAWTPWRAGLVLDLANRAHARLAPRAQPTTAGSAPLVAAPEDAEEAGAPIASDAMLTQARAGRCTVVVDTVGGGVGPDADGAARVSVVAPDRVGLFADIAGLFASRRLVVVSARATTHDGVATDVWTVASPFGDTVVADDLRRALEALERGERTTLQALDRRRSAARERPHAQRRAMPSPPGVAALVVPGASADATVVEVRAPDRPGLLVDVCRAFARAGVVVRSAHVDTRAAQSADTFYLVEPGGARLAPSKVAEVIAAVMDAAGPSGPTTI